MKLIVIPTTKNYTSYLENGADAFLFGLAGFCSDFSMTLSLSEIVNFRKQYPDVELFISCNKTMFDEDIPSLVEALQTLDQCKVTGVLFYDLALLQLKKEYRFSFDLVWNQTHMVTNTKTCQYYVNKGVKYAMLASEITLDEMLDIKENSSMQCMALLYGHPIVAESRRTLLTNYYDFLQKEGTKQLKITEPVSKQTYFIREDATGTSFFYGTVLNGSQPYLTFLQHSFDYGVLREDFIDSSVFLSVLSEFSKIGKQKLLPSSPEAVAWISQMEDQIGSCSTGFFYKKTIFKVKKNEKN